MGLVGTDQSTHFKTHICTCEKGCHEISQLSGVPGRCISSLGSLMFHSMQQRGQPQERGNPTRGIWFADGSHWMYQTPGHDCEELKRTMRSRRCLRKRERPADRERN